jgi:hypothetical protein
VTEKEKIARVILFFYFYANLKHSTLGTKLYLRFFLLNSLGLLTLSHEANASRKILREPTFFNLEKLRLLIIAQNLALVNGKFQNNLRAKAQSFATWHGFRI